MRRAPMLAPASAVALAALALGARAGDNAWEASVLARVQEAYAALETLEATFVQENDWSIHEETQSYRGHLYVRTDGRLRIEYDEPEGHLFVADGRWHWTYVPESGQVLKSPAGPTRAPLSRLFTGVLAGRRVASVSRAGELVALELEPEEELGLSSLTVYVDEQSGLGKRFRWTDVEGNTATYGFEKMQVNVPLADELFVFEPPGDVEVVNLSRGERW